MPRSPLFESTDIQHIRYVWDPEVHEWHGEKCAFFLLKLPSIDGSTLSTVEAIAERRGLISTSVYVLYGYYDLLVRCWATATEREDVVRDFESELPDAETETFVVHDIDYSRWSGRRGEATPKVIGTRQKEIECVVHGSESAQLRAALDTLERDGLVHFYTPPEEEVRDWSKVYLVLRRQRVDDPELTASRMGRLESILSDLKFLRMPTVYYGTGRTIDCVIKGIVPSDEIGSLYLHVLDLKARLEEAGQLLRPMTMILAKAGETDRDHLRLELDGPDSRAVRYLKVQLPEELAEDWARFPDSRRDAALVIFEEYWSEVAESPFHQYFIDLIEGGLTEDTYTLSGSLTFLFTVEAQLRDRVVREILPEQLGRKAWRAEVLKYLEAQEAAWQAELEGDAGEDAAEHARAERLRVARLIETVRNRTDSIGLGESIHLLRRLVEGGVLDGDVVEQVLGKKWFDRYYAASELRNDFSHGRLIGLEAPSAGEWTTLLRRAVPAGLLLAT